MSAQSRRALITLGTLLLCLWPALVRAQHEPERSAAELMDVLMWNREPVGGPFALVDHTGRQRTEADFRGKLLLLYFGFTYCPDLCPTDTPQHLANYVPLFHPRLIGLTGDPSSIRQAARAYKVYYAKVPTAGDDYTVDHSGYIYLMDRAGQYLGFFPPGTPPDRMADVIRPLLK
jgi:cytochrome oxidase Cu insertion factor (SCO1/SenC/PrrC family)